MMRLLLRLGCKRRGHRWDVRHTNIVTGAFRWECVRCGERVTTEDHHEPPR